MLYGGAAFGGKSIALLACALQYVMVPGYAALILRRSFSDLTLPGALIDRSHEWLGNTLAKWNERDHCWNFPSGAMLQFGYIETKKDLNRYQSAEFATICFDELSQFPKDQYNFMFSRLRRLKSSPIPVRMRGATNPGGIGSDWIYDHFIKSTNPNRRFIPATSRDNPHGDRDSYDVALGMLDPVTRAQLRDGDWTIRAEGNLFKRSWLPIVTFHPPLVEIVRAWDLAATEYNGSNDPDYTAGVKMGVDKDGCCYILDVKRFRENPGTRDRLIQQTAEEDGRGVQIRIEKEPGASGKSLLETFETKILFGYSVKASGGTGDKLVRAQPLSAAAEQGRVKLLQGTWNQDFINELTSFPDVSHDDQVDAADSALEAIANPIRLESLRCRPIVSNEEDAAEREKRFSPRIRPNNKFFTLIG